MLRLFSGPTLLVGLALTIVTVSAAFAGNSENEKFVVIKAGRVITMAGPELRNVDILLVDGKIRLVGKNLSYPPTAMIIDARREVVMPGLIHARTRWQLPSYTRAGSHADRLARKEVFLSEIDFEPFLKAGFTTVCFYPYGTGVPGRGAIYRTGGRDDQRDMSGGYLRVTMSSPGRDKKVLRDAISKARKEIEKVEKARKQWEEKQKKAKEVAAKKAPKEGSGDQKKSEEDKKDEASPEKKGEVKKSSTDKQGAKSGESKKADVFTAPKIAPAVLPFVEWIRDKKGPPLLYELRSAADFLHLEDVLKRASELPVARLYLSSSTRSDVPYVLKQLGERKPLVLMPTGVGTLPLTVTRINLAGELVLAGCKIALLPPSDSESSFGDHRRKVADLVRAGLPRDEALKSITLRQAEVLGIDQRVGSIEKGKQADLIFLDGDPLAPDSSVTRVMMLGEIVWEAP